MIYKVKDSYTFPEDALRIFTNGAWKWDWDRSRNEDEYTIFTATFLAEYEVKVSAIVSEAKKHLVVDGHYGVMWLEAEYEYDRPHSYHELEEMQFGIEQAERNLLLIGIPFTEDYKFHGDDVAEKTEKNNELRLKYNLKQKEEEDDG